MGFLDDLIRKFRRKPWIGTTKKADAIESAQRAWATESPVVRPFCDPESRRPCITVCAPKPGCTCRCEAVFIALEEEIRRRGLDFSLGRAKTGCFGTCRGGAFLGFPQKGFFYLNVTPDDIPQIVKVTLVHQRILFPLLSLSPDRSYRSDVIFEKDTGLLAGIDEQVCMVDVARYFIEMETGTPGGKCAPLKTGTPLLQETIPRIAKGKGTAEDLEAIRGVLAAIKADPECDISKTGSPVVAALVHFEEEFAVHVERRGCPLGVCGKMAEAPVEEPALPSLLDVMEEIKPEPEKARTVAKRAARKRVPRAVLETIAEEEADQPGAAVDLLVHGIPEPQAMDERTEEPVVAGPEEPGEAEAIERLTPEALPVDLAHKECILPEDLPEAEAQAGAMAVPTPPPCSEPIPVYKQEELFPPPEMEAVKPAAPEKKKRKPRSGKGEKKEPSSKKGRSPKKSTQE